MLFCAQKEGIQHALKSGRSICIEVCRNGLAGEEGTMLQGRETGRAFREYLEKQEKSAATIEKYLRDVGLFLRFCAEYEKEPSAERTEGSALRPTQETKQSTDGTASERAFRQDQVLAFKKHLQARYRPNSVNSMLNALNCYLKFTGHREYCVRMLKQQRQLFCDENRLLKRGDYRRLVEQADREGRERLSCIIQTLGMTGIRIGELRFMGCECLKRNIIHIEHKGKIRDIVLPKALVELLRAYCARHDIREGQIFVTRYGNPVDRKNIWREMKALCRRAGVQESKVFPHNFRHLFAVQFYEKKKDIVRLADYLGHSSLETTRRYTVISSMQACQRELDLGLLISRPLSGNRGSIRRKRQLRRPGKQKRNRLLKRA